MSATLQHRRQVLNYEITDLHLRHNLLIGLAEQARNSAHPDSQTVLYLTYRAGELFRLLQVYQELSLHLVEEQPAEVVPVEELSFVEEPPVEEPLVEERAQPALSSAPPYIPVEALTSVSAAEEEPEPEPPARPIFLPPGLPVIGRAKVVTPPAPAPAEKAPEPRKTYFHDPIREEMVWETPARREEIMVEARQLGLIEKIE